MSTRRTAKVACQPEWCPVERTLAIIGGVWKVIIIRELLTGTKRYGQLHRALHGVTHKMLTQQLRELELDGVVHREMYPQVPPKVEYSLTALGRRLDPLLQEMHRWGNELREPAAREEPAKAPSGRMRPAGSRRRSISVASFALLASLVLSSRAAAQSLVAAGQTVNGISCDAMEGQRVHIHQHLVILDHGKPVDIPPNVGQPGGRRCIYWLHTHTPDGFIHVEAPLERTFTLGDFFTVWAQPLSRTAAASASLREGETMKVWVDGKPFTGDPRTIPLAAHTDIVIQVGGPHGKPAPVKDWGRL